MKFSTLLTQMCHFRLVIFVMASERTFIMIKPDGVHRGIVGEIIKRFENKGFKLVAMKFMQVLQLFIFKSLLLSYPRLGLR